MLPPDKMLPRGLMFMKDNSRQTTLSSSHQWFSGKISRCHRGAPGSIPGWCNMSVSFGYVWYAIIY